MALKFKELKQYLSRDVKIAICLADDERCPYYTYLLVSDIPEGLYDELYVSKIQMEDLEFSCDVFTKPDHSLDGTEMRKLNGSEKLQPCFEIFLLKTPANLGEEEAKRKVGDPLTYGVFRHYLWYGPARICQVDKSWLRGSEVYEEIHHIESEEFNDLYLYGIGMEDYPNLEMIEGINDWDSEWNSSGCRRYFIALSDTPRADVK